jgi:hypothetical protein
MSAILSLAEKWRTEAALLSRYGDERGASVAELHADELEAAVAADRLEALSCSRLRRKVGTPTPDYTSWCLRAGYPTPDGGMHLGFVVTISPGRWEVDRCTISVYIEHIRVRCEHTSRGRKE